MKNKILMAIESVLFCGFVYFVYSNFVNKTTCGFTVTLDSSGYVVTSTITIMILFYLIGAFSGFVYSIALGHRYKDQIEFYARKNEKLAVQNEIDTDDKEALQRKIASLEIALKNALENKQ